MLAAVEHINCRFFLLVLLACRYSVRAIIVSVCRRLHTDGRLEKTGRFSRPVPAVDNQFLPLDRPAGAAHVVLDAGGIHLEARKHAPDIRVVVQAQNGLAFQSPHQLGHLLVLSEFKLHAITGRLPVRRVQVKQCVRPVISLHALVPVQVFDVGSGQSQVRGRQVLLDAHQVERWRGDGRAPVLPVDLPAEGMLLQVEETGRALQFTSFSTSTSAGGRMKYCAAPPAKTST